jgi:hypothetical protein
METVFRFLRLPEEFLEPIRSIIYEQSLEYPHRYSEELRRLLAGSELEGSFNSEGDLIVKQQTGQLMGSILSFPHLCACNLVAYWMTLEQYLGRSVELRDLPVLVNGDDILFKTNDLFYSLWKENITEIGFELSLGKNYVHSNYLMVNSEPYWKSSVLEKLPYYNIGLLIGKSKLQTNNSVAPIWDYYNKVMAGSSNKLRAHNRFLHLNRKKIDAITFDGLYNLFIDPHFGGLGFDLYPEVRPQVKFTLFQRQFGHYLLDKLKAFTGDKLPVKPITLIQDKKEKRNIIQKYHYGNYKLIPYHNTGTLQNPEYQLVLDQYQRLVEDYSVSKPVMSEVPNIGTLEPVVKKGQSTYEFKLTKDLSVRQPEKSLLRNFRLNKPKILSVRPLLSTPRALVEIMMNDITLGSIS